MKSFVKSVIIFNIFYIASFAEPKVLLSEEAKAIQIELEKKALIEKKEKEKIKQEQEEARKAFKNKTHWWESQTSDKKFSLAPEKKLESLKEEKGSLKSSNKSIFNPSKVLVSLELQEKIAKEKAIEEEKLKKLSKGAYIDENTLNKIESIDSQKITTSENIDKFKEEKKASVSVDLNADLASDVDKNKKQATLNTSVDDFFKETNKEEDVTESQVLKSDENKLAPIVME